MTTTENTTATPKRKADLYIFRNRSIATPESGPPVGAVYFHKKGKGMSIVFPKSRESFAAFPPKPKPEAQPPVDQAQPMTTGAAA